MALTVYDNETITVDNTVKSLTSSKITPDGAPPAKGAIICNSGANAVTFRVDGGDPSATANIYLASHKTAVVGDIVNLRRFKVTRVANDSTIFVSYLRGEGYIPTLEIYG